MGQCKAEWVAEHWAKEHKRDHRTCPWGAVKGKGACAEFRAMQQKTHSTVLEHARQHEKEEEEPLQYCKTATLPLRRYQPRAARPSLLLCHARLVFHSFSLSITNACDALTPTTSGARGR